MSTFVNMRVVVKELNASDHQSTADFLKDQNWSLLLDNNSSVFVEPQIMKVELMAGRSLFDTKVIRLNFHGQRSALFFVKLLGVFKSCSKLE